MQASFVWLFSDSGGPKIQTPEFKIRFNCRITQLYAIFFLSIMRDYYMFRQL